MNRFYLVVNPAKDPGFKLAKEICRYMERNGAVCRYQVHPRSREGIYFSRPEDVPEGTEAVLVLGGDGTMIRAARDLVELDLPLVGVNLGTLGYLTEIPKNEVFPSLDRLLKGEFQIEERMLLQGTLQGRDGEETDLAVNDIVIGRSLSMRAVRCEVRINGSVLHYYNADGMILSTPTGSTAYNLSAGGPVVEPTAHLILLTPIAPHTLNNRCIVLDPDDEVTLRICGSQEDRSSVLFDGDIGGSLAVGDSIVVKASDKRMKLIKLRQTSFLDALRDNMSV